MTRWGERFLSSTRGMVIQHLRRGKSSVSELASVLKLTNNAVRSHLTTLERDGLVRPAGKRAGVRRPETLYELTPEADQLFPSAYHLLFSRLLDILKDRLTPSEIEIVLKEVGASLGNELGMLPHASLQQRAEKALDVLQDMGGLAEIDESKDHLLIRGYSCPLAAAVNIHPEVCRLAESLLSDILQAPVHEVCERNGAPRCAFRVDLNE